MKTANSSKILAPKASPPEPSAAKAPAPPCPYCSSPDTIRRGLRKKKYETQQVCGCKACGKFFTPQRVRGKSFPLRMILDGLSLYNLGHPLEKCCARLKEHFGIEADPSTVSHWIKEFEPLCRYSRMREHGLKLYSPSQIVESAALYHRQVYRYRCHKAKLALLLQDYKHSRYEPLRDFLESVPLECPHEFFREGARASDQTKGFNTAGVKFIEKTNFAVRLAELALQAVAEKKERHDMLQRFMLANDSVTVATEVPVYLASEDIDYLQNGLNFDIPEIRAAKEAAAADPRKVITGHIDILQIRNGAIHILDYKPGAKKERPIGQLVLYALALSRLTGLRIYDFKCAWFDENVYVEFFPLHVVYKLGRGRRESKDQMKMFPEDSEGERSEDNDTD